MERIEDSKQLKIDKLYLRMAQTWSENSYAIRRKVGCLIVKNNSIISDGYNGTPTGFRNVCEYSKEYRAAKLMTDEEERVFLKDIRDDFKAELITYPYVLHAESNAIAKLAKSNNSSDGSTIYITDEPCLECSKMIIQSGIKRVVYNRSYRLHDGIELLKAANIEITQITNI